MANYYTYGAIPNAEETVFGPLSDFSNLESLGNYFQNFPQINQPAPSTPAFDFPMFEAQPVSTPAPAPAPAPAVEESPLQKLAAGNTMAPVPNISAFEEGYTPAAGSETLPQTGEVDNEQVAKVMAQLSLLKPGTFGNMGSVSDPNIAASARTITDTRPAGGLQGQQFEEGYLEAQKASPLLGIWQSGLADVLAENPEAQARVEEMETEREERIAGLEESIPKLKPLSDLLKEGEFKEAFEYAQENGLVDQLMNTDNLKSLRGPFSKEEMSEFFNAIPPEVAKEYTGEGWIFDPSAGVEGSLDPLGTGGEGAMEEGFPDPNRAFTRKDNELVKNLVKIGGAAMLATAVPGLLPGAGGGAGAGAGAGAAGTGGGALAGVKAAAKTVLGIPEVIGKTVAEALGAGVVKSTTAKMIGNAIISGGVTGAKGGDFGDVLKSAALAAGLTFVSDKAIKAVADKLQSTGITDAVKDLPLEGDVAGATSSVAQDAASKIVDGLQEFVVTGSQFGDIAGGIGSAGALASAQDILKQSPAPEIEMPAEELPVEELPVEEPVSPLEEVTVTAQRPPATSLLDVVPPALQAAPTIEEILSETPEPEITLPEEPVVEPLEEAPEPMEEITVEAQRPVTEELVVPPLDLIAGPSVEEIVETLPEPEIEMPVEEPPLEDMEEITIETQRPVTEDLVVPPLDLISAPSVEEIVETLPEPEIEMPIEEPPLEDMEEVTIETTRPVTEDLVVPPLDLISGPTVEEIVETLPEPEIDMPLEESPVDDLEEVTIETTQPVTEDLVVPPLDLISGPTVEEIVETLPEPEIEMPIEEPPLEDMEEVTIETTRPVTEDLVLPPLDLIEPPSIDEIVETLPEPEIDMPLEESPVDDLEEVTIETQRPVTEDLVIPPFDLVDFPDPSDILQESPAPEISYPEEVPEDMEEVTIETQRPVTDDLVIPPFDLVQPPDPSDILKESPAPEISYPEKTPFENLIDKYGSFENLLKLIGAIGSATSRPKTPTTPAPTTGGGLGGALPQYTYTRQQLSPDIDYYTYGTRPEAKFFEDQMQLMQPTQPAAPEVGLVPPEDQPVFAQGGLTGYARGGSKTPRYVAGPGSGRDDKIPALLSDGEYVIDAETLALLGDGSTKEGARRMDKFRANIRKHKGRALSRGRISPNAKSPDKYMGGGLI